METPGKINLFWKRAIVALIAALPFAVGFSHDLLRPYTVTPDADLIYLVQALRLGDGLSQTYNDHTGHAYILILYVWLEFWSFVGVIPAPSHSIAIATQNIDDYIQPLVVAGRALSMSIGSLFSLAVMAGARAMGMPGLLVIATGLLFSISEGITAQTLIMRAEMVSSLAVAACFIALIQSQQAHGRAHLAWLVLAGVCAILSLDAKVQAIIVLLGLPVLTLAMAPFHKPAPPETVTIETVIFSVYALAAGIPLMSVLILSLTLSDMAGPNTGYQALLALYLAACMVGFGYIYREPARRQITGALALLAGFAVGTCFLFVWYSQRLLDALVHFVEHMSVFSTAITRDGLSANLIINLVPYTIKHRAEYLTPTGLLEVLSFILMAILLRRGEWRRATLMFLMIGLMVLVETLFRLRGFQPNYKIYVEFWLFLAVGIGLTPILDWEKLPTQLFLGGVTLGLAAWMATISLRDGMIPRQRLENVCYQANGYFEPALARRFEHYCDVLS